MAGMCEDAGRVREEFFRELADGTVTERLFSSVSDIVFCMKNRDGVYVSANEAFARRLGLGSRWEVVGKRAEDLFAAPRAAEFRRQDIEVLAGEGGFRDRLELIPQREGGMGWYLATKVPVHGRDGGVIGVASISQDLKVVAGGNLGFSGLAKVIDLMERRFAERLDRSELAREAGLSEQQLERRMKRVFGLSVAAFMRKVRVENASRMLIETSTPLAEVALACGYSEQSTFNRQFKAVVGVTPGDYRGRYGGWW